MVQKMFCVINDHVSVAYQTVPTKAVFVQDIRHPLFVGINDTGNIKDLFDEFPDSFNNNIDFNTAVQFFNNNIKIIHS